MDVWCDTEDQDQECVHPRSNRSGEYISRMTLKWFRQVRRRPLENAGKHVMALEPPRVRKRGRPMTMWMDAMDKGSRRNPCKMQYVKEAGNDKPNAEFHEYCHDNNIMRTSLENKPGPGAGVPV